VPLINYGNGNRKRLRRGRRVGYKIRRGNVD